MFIRDVKVKKKKEKKQNNFIIQWNTPRPSVYTFYKKLFKLLRSTKSVKFLTEITNWPF